MSRAIKIFILIAVVGVFVITFIVGKRLIFESQLRACKTNVNEIWKALVDYVDEYGAYPEDIKRLPLLKKVPKCPSSGKEYIYQVSEDREDFVLKCPNPELHKLKEIYASSTTDGVKFVK